YHPDLTVNKGQYSKPPESGWQRDLFQEFGFVEHPADSESHVGHRVLGDCHGKLRLRPQWPREMIDRAARSTSRLVLTMAPECDDAPLAVDSYLNRYVIRPRVRS